LLVSVKNAIRMFAEKAGARLVAYGGDIEIKALKKSIDIAAKMNVTLNAERIVIGGKEEVVINGGGSYTRWNASGIEHGTNGSWVEHAASHTSPGPSNAPVDLTLPVTELKELPNTLLLRLGSHTQNAYQFAGEPYRLFKDGVEIDSGVIDEHGQILVKDHQQGTASYEARLTNGARFTFPVHDQPGGSAEHRLANEGFRVAQDGTSRHADYGSDQPGNKA